MGLGQLGTAMCQEAVCVHQQASERVPGTGGPKQQAPSALCQLVVKLESSETSEQELRKCLLRSSLWQAWGPTYVLLMEVGWPIELWVVLTLGR